VTTEARKEVLDFTKGIAITTIQEGKACLSDGNIQSCLSTCGLADFTGPVAPVCDLANGTIYLFKGEFAQAGSSAFAVIPIVGSIGKQGSKTIVKTSKEGLEKARKGSAKVVRVSKDKLIEELRKNNIKFSAENIVKVKKMRDGFIVFLETGGKYSGWKHIFELKRSGGLTRYEEIKKAGLVTSKEELEKLIFGIIRNDKKVKTDKGFNYIKKVRGKELKVVVGTNGYIVTVSF